MAASVLIALLDGLTRGGLYFLFVIGLVLTFGTMGIINFAHGSFLMLGSFIAWWFLGNVLEEAIGSFWVAALISAVIVGTIGILLERYVIRRMYKADLVYQLLLFFGFILIIQGAVLRVFATYPITIFQPSYLGGSINLVGEQVSRYSLFVLVLSLAVGGAIWFLLNRTRFGRACRAVSGDRETADALGINVGRVFMVFFGIGVTLAAIAGSLGMSLQSVNTSVAVSIVITCFVIIVIGGMSSLLGSFVAAFILGIADSLFALFLPEARFVVPFVIMAIILIARPEGLFALK